MEQIYRSKLWGDNGTDFYSGHGSHQPQLVSSYITVVTSFLRSFKQPLTVCDLGCGDFNIGKELVLLTQKYIAVDIVADLIHFNSKRFKHPHLEFHCLDIAKDGLPQGDCVIVRQVLQHLSNAEVQNVVDKLAAYKYVLLTEHLPEGEFEPNIDIISGQGTRLKKQSGLNLLKAPFYMHSKESTLLLSQNSLDYGGNIVTTLYRMF